MMDCLLCSRRIDLQKMREDSAIIKYFVFSRRKGGRIGKQDNISGEETFSFYFSKKNQSVVEKNEVKIMIKMLLR